MLRETGLPAAHISLKWSGTLYAGCAIVYSIRDTVIHRTLYDLLSNYSPRSYRCSRACNAAPDDLMRCMGLIMFKLAPSGGRGDIILVLSYITYPNFVLK